MAISISKYLFLFFTLLAAFGCRKDALLIENPPKVAKVEFKGYVMRDTLEFVYKGKVTGTAFNSSFGGGGLFEAGGKIEIRKKVDHTIVGEHIISENPFSQVKTIFYDGSAIFDNIELTPVTEPENMGIRLSFSTTFSDFYGGPVDIVLFHSVFDWNTFSTTNIPVKKVENITSSFGDFVELPALPANTDLEMHSYLFKVYKAGTTELPYTKLDNVQLSDPDNNYGGLSFAPGESQLIIISPRLFDDRYVGDGYLTADIAAAFR